MHNLVGGFFLILGFYWFRTVVVQVQYLDNADLAHLIKIIFMSYH